MSERFYGTYTPRLDDKARLTLPHRYREAFKAGAVVVRGRSRCLYVFTTAGFDGFAEEAINAKVTDPVAIGQARYMLANSDEQTPDAQGRILLSARMREFAGLDRDLVLTGQGHRMEIWDAAAGRPMRPSRRPPTSTPIPHGRRRGIRVSPAAPGPAERPGPPIDHHLPRPAPAAALARLPPCQVRSGWGPEAGDDEATARRRAARSMPAAARTGTAPQAARSCGSGTDHREGGVDEAAARVGVRRPDRRRARRRQSGIHPRCSSTPRSGSAATPCCCSPVSRPAGDRIDRDPTALAAATARVADAGLGDRLVTVHAVNDAIGAVGGRACRRVGRRGPVRPRRLLDATRRARAGFRLRGGRPAGHADGSDDGPLTAADVLNTYDDRDLARVLPEYGEERFARRIAAAVVRERAAEPFATSARLVDLVRRSIPAAARRTGGHPAKRTFQALRIEVNDELGAVRRAVPAALDVLADRRADRRARPSTRSRTGSPSAPSAHATTSDTPTRPPVDLPGHGHSSGVWCAARDAVGGGDGREPPRRVRPVASGGTDRRRPDRDRRPTAGSAMTTDRGAADRDRIRRLLGRASRAESVRAAGLPAAGAAEQRITHDRLSRTGRPVRSALSRVPFVVALIAVLGGGISAVLYLNTRSDESGIRTGDAQQTIAESEPADRGAQPRHRRPGRHRRIAQQAQALGMVPAGRGDPADPRRAALRR